MSPQSPARRVAVIGAGWSGLACAVAATQAGHAVTVFEAAARPGGRARSLAHAGTDAPLDNGQHILIGAYTETLRLMDIVGASPQQLLARMPLTLRFPDQSGLALGRLPAPLDVCAGIFTARGWHWRDRWALLRAALGWQRAGFTCPPHATVADLCGTLTRPVMDTLIEPLCVSSLNLPARAASGAVFLRVLRDALFGVRGGSQLLLPRTDLGRLFPIPALQWLSAHGGDVRLRHRVAALAPVPGGWAVDGDGFDHVVLACPSWEAVRLACSAGLAGDAHAARWLHTASALRHTAIATLYAQAPAGTRLPLPMLALRGGPAQFVFDRGQLSGEDGLLAFVASACEGTREEIEPQILAQAADQLALDGLHAVRTVVERRATFACTPGLLRPTQGIAPNLLACGDYIQGPYPATLEGAVRSGIAAARALRQASL